MRQYKLNIYLTLILFFATLICKGQDPQFSQFYAAPVYLNPALAGETTQGRASLLNRYQWPGFSSAFKTLNFTYDHNIDYYNVGLALMVTQDNSGSGALRYTNYSGVFSQRFKINRNWTIKGGIQLGQAIKDLDINKLTFGSQLYNGTGLPSNVLSYYQRSTYYDISSGVLMYSSKSWAGFAVHHLNRPNQSLLSQDNVFLPLKFSLHGGQRFNLSSGTFNRDIIAAFNYKAQGKYDQLDIGAYYEQLPIAVGIWYRGLPIKQYKPGYGNRESIIFLTGYNYKLLKIAYSFDLTISKLAASTYGAHEFSITYEFMNTRNRLGKSRKFVPCAKF